MKILMVVQDDDGKDVYRSEHLNMSYENVVEVEEAVSAALVALGRKRIAAKKASGSK